MGNYKQCVEINYHPQYQILFNDVIRVDTFLRTSLLSSDKNNIFLYGKS